MSRRENTPEEFMGTFFGAMGEKSTIRSHEPHATLANWKGSWPEVRDLGWVTVEPYNKHGSIEIKATPAGLVVARERAKEAARLAFPELYAGEVK